MDIKSTIFWKRWHSAATMLLLASIGVLVIVIGKTSSAERIDERAGWYWAAFAGILVALLFVVGHGALGNWSKGALIDDENRVSLARFQFLLWTVLVFSSIPVAVVVNILVGMVLPRGTFRCLPSC